MQHKVYLICYDNHMKLYLSSYRIPNTAELEKLLGKPLQKTSAALIPNAKDYYSERARTFKIGELVTFMQQLGLTVEIVDLRQYADPQALREKLAGFDLIWAMGGNTFILRDEMRRSGFERIIVDLLKAGTVYGGDSAGALVAGSSINGIELADEPGFAEAVINEGLHLVPFVILPHIDNPQYMHIPPVFRDTHKDEPIIELKDSQAVIFNGEEHVLVDAPQS